VTRVQNRCGRNRVCDLGRLPSICDPTGIRPKLHFEGARGSRSFTRRRMTSPRRIVEGGTTSNPADRR
jgi:hypothetical protein